MSDTFEFAPAWETFVIPNIKDYKAEEICFRPIKNKDDDEILGIVLNVSEKEILILFNPNYYIDDILEVLI